MTDYEEIEHSARDSLTGAMINIKFAREELEHCRLDRADEYLSAAMKQMLMAGAKDVGQIPNGRDLPNRLPEKLGRARTKLERRTEEVEDLQSEIEDLQAKIERLEDANNNSEDESGSGDAKGGGRDVKTTIQKARARLNWI